MAHRTRPLVAALAAVVLLGAGLSANPPTGASAAGPADRADPSDPAVVAVRALVADSDGGVSLRREGGVVTFVGTPAGGPLDNPLVRPSMTAAGAARAHLDRYGAALGTTRPGTTLVPRGVTRTVAGTDVVRFEQRVGGLPVLGGEVAVTVDERRRLTSILSSLSGSRRVAAPRVTAARAGAIALAAVVKRTGVAVDVVDQGRWVLDPAVLGGGATYAARSVHRVEVTDGVAVRRLVLVDDQTGAVLMDLDRVARADRVVCDYANAVVSSPPPICNAGFARVEGAPATGIADVDLAYDLSGATSDFYDQIGDVDLTDLLGIPVGGTKRLASTTRICVTGSSCPYANAFWNGTGMYYGQGYAGADDVVGHEITHGVIEKNADLLYWGQSGAINESLADIMGEILDHRRGVDDDSAWLVGEEIPGGAIRSMSTPATFSQPDRMTSGLYWNDPSYLDNQGVHYNSGVGNKTAYLIAVGGTFNGHTVTSIDAGNPALTKTATLYLGVIASLTSGSDYADLARVLDQSCADLVGTAGFTTADCVEVHDAGLATELTTTPPALPQPPDATAGCPDGLVKRVLLDSEAGTPTTTFTSSSGTGSWTRDPSFLGSNAVSGKDSWFGINPDPVYGDAQVNALVAVQPLALPAGQPSFLHFQGWHLLEYSGATFYDGGTVEVDDTGDVAPPVDVATLPWVNGPTRTLAAGTNPAAGRQAFAGDSNGWVASRLDLTSYAGTSVRLQFTTNGDVNGSYIGWWLDDVVVYTCDLQVGTPTIVGTPRVGGVLGASPGAWAPQPMTFTYAWLRDGIAIAGATGRTYRPGAGDVGRRLSVRVTGRSGAQSAVAVSAATARVARGTLGARVPTITGQAKVGKRLTAKPGSWTPAGVRLAYQWFRNATAIGGARQATYVVKAADRGARLKVRVTGTKPGYTTASRTSRQTGRVGR